ncbi:hypothetical protein SISNIDRAFT_553315 [Sistotremastrum niveocremeum HHB9708]|uniref:Cryptic loci regulator 2 N-terminal domain-containing protein n=2 Tax=Sistotremastraceae TaxID=3402574 RepID=A0A164MWM1_9AGAM|nr:hypothetical protein SISNIDRAFT_553315 [Sistotremastrum niveocremeum HHB9708]KZT32458.1 hypothetical protein SISSUDRAFT_1133139 [Sistotremastrum suecicum HHB10207 ss-3]
MKLYRGHSESVELLYGDQALKALYPEPKEPRSRGTFYQTNSGAGAYIPSRSVDHPIVSAGQGSSARKQKTASSSRAKSEASVVDAEELDDLHGSSYIIRSRTKQISFLVTDATGPSTPSHYSFSPEPNPHTGIIDYMAPLPHSHSQSLSWRKKIGDHLAGGILQLSDASSAHYSLSDFPSGYTLFEHRKGDRYSIKRRDRYLYGSGSVMRFRSPEEFYPHGEWLIRGASSSIPCECKYCSPSSTRRDDRLCLP